MRANVASRAVRFELVRRDKKRQTEAMARISETLSATTATRRKRDDVKDATEGDLSSMGEPTSPRERVVRNVIRRLYDGRLEPGDRIVEAQLTGEYGVSRGPVREALNRLAAMGVVELTPQRGAHIRVLTLSDAIDSLIVVQSLVSTAARLAAMRRTMPDAADRLHTAVDQLAGFDETSSSSQYAHARDAFYATLTALASNSALVRTLPKIDIHLIRVQFRSVLRSVDRRRHKDYQEIADAVTAGNPKRAERAAYMHIERAIEALTALRADGKPG